MPLLHEPSPEAPVGGGAEGLADNKPGAMQPHRNGDARQPLDDGGLAEALLHLEHLDAASLGGGGQFHGPAADFAVQEG
ncbi:MAG: hypothetical protein ACYC61_25380 [Isosphaeraceae bacterium]